MVDQLKDEKLIKRTDKLRSFCPEIKNIKLWGEGTVKFEWREYAIISSIPARPCDEIIISKTVCNSCQHKQTFYLSCERILDKNFEWSSDIKEVVSQCLYPLLENDALHYIK